MRRLWIFGLSLAMAAGFVYAQQATPMAGTPQLTRSELAAKGITPPVLLSSVDPEYSDDARRKHINGLCLVSLIVDTQGNPQNPRIVHCTDSSFEQGSIDAVKQYRFKPAATQDGKPVPVTIHVQINYHLIVFPFERHLIKAHPIGPEISTLVQCSFIPQQGGASVPDSDGVYPLTRSVTGPRIIEFTDKGYAQIAFAHEGNSICNIVLTISEKGKPSDPQVTHCERPELEKPAVESLLKSQYTPGFVKGKAVPMRASIHLEYGGDAPK
jgi:TonB family protein